MYLATLVFIKVIKTINYDPIMYLILQNEYFYFLIYFSAIWTCNSTSTLW